jgi:hypothetical protein
MLIRKDETIVETAHRPSARNANIGDPFAIKFIAQDFQAVFPYHRLSMVTMKDDLLIFFFDGEVSVECSGTNLRAILDSVWTARLQVVEETHRSRILNKPLSDGEIVVESLRYCDSTHERII